MCCPTTHMNQCELLMVRIVHHERKLSTVLFTTNTRYWWYYPPQTWVIDGVVVVQFIPSIVYHEHKLATVLSIPSTRYKQYEPKLATVLPISNTGYRQHWWYLLPTTNIRYWWYYAPQTWVIDGVAVVQVLHSIVYHEHTLATVLSITNTSYKQYCLPWT